MFKSATAAKPKSSAKSEATPKPESKPIYWDGILDLAHIDSKGYELAVEKLIHGEYKSLDFDLKHKRGKYPVYGIRLNDTARVLCTEIEVEGKKYLVLLEVLPTHDYDKSRFMQEGVLDAYIDLNLPYLAAFIKKKYQTRRKE